MPYSALALVLVHPCPVDSLKETESMHQLYITDSK